MLVTQEATGRRLSGLRPTLEILRFCLRKLTKEKKKKVKNRVTFQKESVYRHFDLNSFILDISKVSLVSCNTHTHTHTHTHYL
jgi:hypothetical protein